MRQLTIFLLLLLLSPAACAKLYKWVDANGNVTYSERKPSDSTVEEVKLRGVSAVSKEQAQERLDEIKGKGDAGRNEGKPNTTEATQTTHSDKQNAAACGTYRENLRVLQSGPRLKTADGSFLDDKGRAERVVNAQKLIKDNCK